MLILHRAVTPLQWTGEVSVAKNSRMTAATSSRYVPILDRSRSRLRLPVELLSEALRQVSSEGLASPVATVRMETGGIMVDGKLDPLAKAMLQVISSASMMVAVDVQAHSDSSLTTIWGTPGRAVITSSLDCDLVDITPVRLARLPETLSDIILLRPPESTATGPVTVPTAVMAEADNLRADPDLARAALSKAGLPEASVELILAIQSASSRRWKISSTWSTDDGQQIAAVRGLDAGAAGQWLVEMTARRDRPGSMTLTPQSEGDTLKALRQVLPVRWVGTPLNPEAT